MTISVNGVTEALETQRGLESAGFERVQVTSVEWVFTHKSRANSRLIVKINY